MNEAVRLLGDHGKRDVRILNVGVVDDLIKSFREKVRYETPSVCRNGRKFR